MRNNVLVKCKGNSMRLVMKNGKTKTTASFWFGDDEIKKIRKMNTYDREIFIDIERIIVVMKYDNEYAIDLCDVHRDEYTGVATGTRIRVTIPEDKIFSNYLAKPDEYKQANFKISQLAQETIQKMLPSERRAFIKTLMTHFQSAYGEDVDVFLDCGRDFYFRVRCHGGLFSGYDGGLIYEPTVIIGKDRKSHTAITYGKHT